MLVLLNVPQFEKELEASFCSIMECSLMEIKYNNSIIGFLLDQMLHLCKMYAMRRPYRQPEEEWRKYVRSVI